MEKSKIERTNFQNLFLRYVGYGRQCLFLTSNITNTYTVEMEDVSRFDVFIALFTFIGMLFRHIFSYICDCFLLYIVIIFWSLAHGFGQLVDANLDDKSLFIKLEAKRTEEIMRNFEILKRFSKSLNEALSVVVLFFLLESLLYYATSSSTIFVGNGWITTARGIVSFLITVGFMFLAADGCKQV